MPFIPDHTNTCSDETNITIFDIKIQEPVTALTDFFITICCWYIFFRSRHEVQKNHVTDLYRYFFFMIGLSTLFGGIFGHVLCYRLGIAFKLPGWVFSMIAVMICERAAIMHTKKVMRPNVGKFFANANIVELVIMIIITCVTLNFFFVEFHAFYGLLIVTGSFELFNYIKTKEAASKWILISVAISCVAAVVHVAELSPHKWFNYLDAAHSIMCISAFVMYGGVKRIKFDIPS
ncbi:MAG: hypothetical protein H7Y00_15550 [Fimbriimonadaceae bacterium]|nr:hypothetical protein [Chitinophagales bacterium]